MADNTARVVLTAEDRTAAAIASARANLAGLQSAAAGVSVALGGIGAGLTLAGLAATVKSSIDAADAMNDLSQKVGISVRELAKYELAAKQSGASMESIARGIKGLSGFMLENSAALRSVGVTATDADGALRQLADLFKDMGEEGGIQKTALAVKLFGKAGMDLIPMLNLGSAGLEEAAEKSKRYAKAMETIAPLSDKFNDDLAEMAMNSKVMGLNIANYLLEPLTNMVKALNDLSAGGERAQKQLQFLADAGHPIARAVQAWSGVLGGLGFGAPRSQGFAGPRNAAGLPMSAAEKETADLAAFDAAAAAFQTKREALARAQRLIGKEAASGGADPFDALIKSIREKTAVLQADAAAEEKLTEAQKFAVKVMADLRDGTLKLADAKKKTLAADLEAMLAADGLAKVAETARKAEEDYRKEQAAQLQASMKAVDSLAEQVEKQRRHNEEIGLTAEQLARLSDMRDAEAIAAKQQALAYAQLHSTGAAEIELLQDQIDKLQQLRSLRADGAARQVMADANKKAAEDWKRFTEQIEQSLTDALMRGFENGKSFGKNFVDSLQASLKTAVLKIAVQAIVDPIMGGIKTAVLGGVGQSVGGSILTNGISSMGLGAAQAGVNTAAYTAFGSMGAEQAAMLAAQDSVFGMAGTSATLEAAGASSAAGIAGALPYVGLGLAALSVMGAFDGNGDAQRTGRFFAPFAGSNAPGSPMDVNLPDGSRYNWLNNSWFSADMQPELDKFDASLQAMEQGIIDKLGLSASQIATVNDRLLSVQGERRYGFGMEHTSVAASGVFDQITADRMQTIADALGMSLKDLQDQMSGAAKTAKELADESARLAAEQNKAKAQALLAGMGATLGAIDSVTGLRSGILSSIAGIRGGNTYDSRMAGLQSLLAGETDIRRQVELAGQMKDLVLERYQSERSAIEANRAAADDAAAAMRAGLMSIGTYARSLLLSDLSPLTAPQRLAESQSQFESALARARQGDAGALGSLSGAAGTYLQEARGFFASSSRYSDVFGSVQGALAQLGLSAESVTATGDWQAQLLAVDNAAAANLEDLAGFTEDWTVNLETLLVDQTREFEALGVRLADVADNTRGLDARIAVLIDTALGARFEKLVSAVEKSAAETARAMTNAVQVTVRS